MAKGEKTQLVALDASFDYNYISWMSLLDRLQLSLKAEAREL